MAPGIPLRGSYGGCPLSPAPAAPASGHDKFDAAAPVAPLDEQAILADPIGQWVTYPKNTIGWLQQQFEPTPYLVTGARITLVTERVWGWNEIDAVQLVGTAEHATTGQDERLTEGGKNEESGTGFRPGARVHRE